MEASALFPTPLWSASYPQAGDLELWAAHILRLESADPIGVSLTNQGGWHSQTSLVTDATLQPLFHWIAARARQAFQHYGWDLNRASPNFNNAWAMVNRRGHGVRTHLHPNSLFSGVFYLTAPPGSGAIAFLDPRAGAQVLHPPLQADASPFAAGRVVRQPRPGLLLLFPAWLWHEVEPGQSDSPRICVSFNIGMKPVP